MEDPSVYYDKPLKTQKHPHYEHRGAKLYKKNNEFSDKNFQRVRRVSNKKKLVNSLRRIGKCLNNATPADIPTQGLQKVCFILINNYAHDKHDPKIGPMNDGYLIGLNQHRLGFRIFYLHNCNSSQYSQFLQFFLKYTLQQLTVFYSGRNTATNGSPGIEFKEDSISSSDLGKLIAESYNRRCKAVFISDTTSGGSVYDIISVNKESNIISLSAGKSTDPDSKEGRRSHGIFTYYFCKIIYENPNITPYRLAERMNPSLKRFNETFFCEVSDHNSESRPIFN
ncbi:hypothetical protein M9Y10_005329 [Tritrichomonas musculus]|uniref:Uncharacterized protein n=1 Tax=Tritrichomonas musculus TaxID=1915356 RepID=A0ABR2JLG3_9EUKA